MSEILEALFLVNLATVLIKYLGSFSSQREISRYCSFQDVSVYAATLFFRLPS